MRFIEANGLGRSMPIYTTRPYGMDSVTACYSLSPWMTLLAMYVVWFNVIVWGLLGLYTAGTVIL